MKPSKELQFIDEALGFEELPEDARDWLEGRKSHVQAVVASIPRPSGLEPTIPSNKRQQNG